MSETFGWLANDLYKRNAGEYEMDKSGKMSAIGSGINTFDTGDSSKLGRHSGVAANVRSEAVSDAVKFRLVWSQHGDEIPRDESYLGADGPRVRSALRIPESLWPEFPADHDDVAVCLQTAYPRTSKWIGLRKYLTSDESTKNTLNLNMTCRFIKGSAEIKFPKKTTLSWNMVSWWSKPETPRRVSNNSRKWTFYIPSSCNW